MPLPEGRKNYTKSKPIKFEEFLPTIEWWQNRKENNQAWTISAEDIAKNNFNLDIKNPNSLTTEDLRSPGEIVVSVIESEKRIVELMQEIQKKF